MKNEKEINSQMEILKELYKELDKYDKKIDELISNKDLEDNIRQCPPKKRAEVYWTAAFGIYTNKYLDLLLEEKDPELHPIQKEIKRLNDFRIKLVKSDKTDENLEKNKSDNKKKKDSIYKQIRKLNG